MSDRIIEGDKNPQFKAGIVKGYDPKTGLHRVEFPDEDGVVSHWIGASSQGSQDNKEVDPFAVGEMVDIQFDWRGENGRITGAAFNKVDTPPWEDPNKRGRQYSDGAELTHNTETHTTEATAENVNLGPEGRTPSSGVGHLVHVTYGSSAGMHPIATGSPAVKIKD